MPTSWSASSVCIAPLSVSLIRTSRIVRARLTGQGRSALVGAVAGGGLRFLGGAPQPGGTVVVGGRLDLAPRLADAGADLFLGRRPGALLAPLGLLLDPLGLRLELLLGAGAGDVLGLTLDLLDQLADALL